MKDQNERLKDIDVLVLGAMLASPEQKLRNSAIKRAIKGSIPSLRDKSLDVALARSLGRLQVRGLLERDDRGHDEGVWYSIPVPERERARIIVYARNEFPSKLQRAAKKLGIDSRYLVMQFPYIFLYSALVKKMAGRKDEFEFFVMQAREMATIAVQAYVDDLVDRYASSSKLTRTGIEHSLKEIEEEVKATMHFAIEKQMIGKDVISVINGILELQS